MAEKLEQDIKQEYLNTMRRFEEGEDGIGVLDVLKVAFKYYFSSPRHYFKTFLEERVRGNRGS